MFKQLAYVVSFSLLCSLFVSLTLIPMLANLILKEEKKIKQNKLASSAKRIFKRIEDGLRNILDYLLKHPLSIILSAVGLLLISLFLIRFIGKEYLPQTDGGEVRLTVEMDVGTRLAVMDTKLKMFQK
ncbi:MAG: efflux RND transporter permease subunit [Candidatus Aminicenantia bacterium]